MATLTAWTRIFIRARSDHDEHDGRDLARFAAMSKKQPRWRGDERIRWNLMRFGAILTKSRSVIPLVTRPLSEQKIFKTIFYISLSVPLTSSLASNSSVHLFWIVNRLLSVLLNSSPLLESVSTKIRANITSSLSARWSSVNCFSFVFTQCMCVSGWQNITKRKIFCGTTSPGTF